MNAIVPAALAATPALPLISPLHARRLAITAGVLEDIEREDDQDGYEDAEDVAFWSIVGSSLNDACGICGYWTCRCTSGQIRTPPAGVVVLVPVGASGQCSVCQGWFDDWPGGVCGACQSNGY